jgi:hypothetical protein
MSFARIAHIAFRQSNDSDYAENDQPDDRNNSKRG